MDTSDPCCDTPKQKRDLILWLSFFILSTAIGSNVVLELFDYSHPPLHHFAHAAFEILRSMWWGVALGILIVGVMHKIPRDFFSAVMGRGNNFAGLVRAVIGGVFLDLCCHGILLVAAKLYERGVSLPQVVAFLVASPWNSVSLTLVLIGLIGLKWTLLYIAGSVLIALVTGLILQRLIAADMLPDNPHKSNDDSGAAVEASWMAMLKDMLRTLDFSPVVLRQVIKDGWREGKVIIKWLLFGTIIAASLRAFVPTEMFETWLGPSVAGLFITLIIATIVEICSEGSAPIAGEIVTNAHAPGNGFTFLMAGVATDYTEIMSVRAFTGSWVIAFALPLITVPQVLLIGWIMNISGGGL